LVLAKALRREENKKGSELVALSFLFAPLRLRVNKI